MANLLKEKVWVGTLHRYFSSESFQWGVSFLVTAKSSEERLHLANTYTDGSTNAFIMLEFI